jgi:Na+/melibiose symporter-like transporter
MQKYLEYLYLFAAILLLILYQRFHQDIGVWAGYGIIGGMILFAFLFSLRRTIRRMQEKNERNSNEKEI